MKSLITNISVLSETTNPTTGFNRMHDETFYSVIVRADVEIEDDSDDVFQETAVGFAKTKSLDGAYELATTNAITNARAKCNKMIIELKEKKKLKNEKMKLACDKTLNKLHEINSNE